MFRFVVRAFMATLFLLFVACANRAKGPQGGPKDLTPPHPVKSTPKNGAVDFKGKKIDISFNEYISLNKTQENVIISPPQVTPATILSSSKKVSVILEDTMKDNTTYTIDFGNSLVDLNEQNPLPGYTFSFSTGSTLDTLQIAGTVLDASNLNPLAKVIVGIYDHVNDSTFQKTMPLRIAKTDDFGRFCIKNVRAGSYHIFALNDLNSDYKYNDPNEQIAFGDALVTPSAKTETVIDTIKPAPAPKGTKENKNAVKKDSVISVQKTIFYPNDLVLKAFKKDVYKQYYQKTERKDPNKVSFFFNTYNKEKPVVKPFNFKASTGDVVRYSAKYDTITYWVADSATMKADTLKFTLEYKKTNTLKGGGLIMGTDTINAVNIQKTSTKKSKKSKRVAAAPQFLQVETNIQSPFDLYSPIQLTVDMPLRSIDEKKIHLQSKKDSVWKEIPIKVERYDTIGLQYKYSISNAWEPEVDYKFTVDSAAIFSLYNTHNDKIENSFQAKNANQYATLTVSLLTYNDKAVIQLIDSKESVVKQLRVKNKGTTFEHLNPGDYYLRLFIDSNQNGQWDVGDYEGKRQPEEMYYFNQVLHLRQNWELEQEWDYSSIPLPSQKPQQLFQKK
ncbi:MAG: Ig-like domain-containing domain [Paludibacteraceae bacterium]|nr:Ig-like domain-containing domain [Paludibacteraceae bacterium]